MSCCPPNITSFVNESITTVPYTPALQSAHGPTPFVEVLYVNELGELQGGMISGAVTFTGGNINVNHGGPATGLILIR